MDITFLGNKPFSSVSVCVCGFLPLSVEKVVFSLLLVYGFVCVPAG